MKFGYLLVVAEHETVDYLQLAYALALSIKNTQKQGFDQVALVIDTKDKLKAIKSPWVFDHVIEWNEQTFWNGRSWMDELTPFDYTEYYYGKLTLKLAYELISGVLFGTALIL